MNTSQLSHAWKSRKAELQSQCLQPYSDVLFAHLKRAFAEDRPFIQDNLLERIQTATKVSELSVPIFTYNTCWGGTREYRKNWHDTLAVFAELPPATLYKIFRFTDICQRLSLEFGPEFWVKWRPTGVLTASPIIQYELMLCYYPGGLCRTQTEKLEAVAQKYTGRINYAPENEVIWNGNYDDIDPVTPPPSPPSSPPPVLRATSDVTREYECAQKMCFCNYDSE
jgi:hypothetical protein